MKAIRRQDSAPTDSTASTTPVLIEVKAALYIAIEGTGRPGTEHQEIHLIDDGTTLTI